jgi:membrane AbrB-like protein
MGDRIRASRTLGWLCAVVSGTVASLVLAWLGVASASLLGGCLGAAAVVLWLGRGGDLGLRVSRPFRGLAQAVIGVHLGFAVQVSTVVSLGAGWLVVLAVLASTIAACMYAAWWVARTTTISLPTARMGLMPGGASVSIAISDDVGTDPRIVAVMQYSRVYLILLSLPFVATLLEHGSSGGSGGLPETLAGNAWLGIAVVVGSTLVTQPLMRLVSFPSGYLLLPLLIGMGFASLDHGPVAAVPSWLLALALEVLGLFVGVQFTVESLRQARDALPVIIGAVLLVMLLCAGLGFLLALVLGRSLLEGYLATTPGGLNVILGVVAGGSADATFVTAAQVLRIVTMLLAVPLVGAWHVRGSQAGPAGRDPVSD